MRHTISTLIITLLLSVATGTASTAQSLVSISIDPDTVFAYMANAIDPIDAHITITDELGENVVAAIDPTTVRINENIIATDFELIIDSIGFSSDRVLLTLAIIDLIDHYTPFYDLSLQPLSITGSFTNGDAFQFDTEIQLRGHASGDLNHDNSIDITDILLLVGWLFNSAELPFGDPVQADMNKDSQTNVSDLLEMIQIVFWQ